MARKRQLPDETAQHELWILAVGFIAIAVEISQPFIAVLLFKVLETLFDNCGNKFGLASSS